LSLRLVLMLAANGPQLALGREITSEVAAWFAAQIYTFLSGGHQNPGLGLGAVMQRNYLNFQPVNAIVTIISFHNS